MSENEDPKVRRVAFGVFDVPSVDARRCLSCGLRCAKDEMVCIGCGSFVSRLWPPPGDPRASHSEANCKKPRAPNGCSTERPCWEQPSQQRGLRVVGKGGER